MADPRVTVVIPTWRRPAMLAEALASVRGQTFGDFECLIIDDGSRDGTEELVESATAVDDRIRYVDLKAGEPPGRPDGKRVATARNFGVNQARAALIAFLDDDDIWLPHKLERQMAALNDSPHAGGVSARIEKFGAEAGTWPGSDVPSEIDFDLLFRGNEVATSTMVARTDLLRRLGGFDETLPGSEDYELWMRLAHQAPIRFLPEVLVRYRVHTANISAKGLMHYDHLSQVYASIREHGIITAARHDALEARSCWLRAGLARSPSDKARFVWRAARLWARSRLASRSG